MGLAGGMLGGMAISELLDAVRPAEGGTQTDKWGLGRALSARYDERSQILYELNKPIVTQRMTRKTKNSTFTTEFTLSKLEVILVLVMVYAFINDFPMVTRLLGWLGVDEKEVSTTTDDNGQSHVLVGGQLVVAPPPIAPIPGVTSTDYNRTRNRPDLSFEGVGDFLGATSWAPPWLTEMLIDERRKAPKKEWAEKEK